MACSKRNSNMIKCLVFLVSILIVILVALAITLVRRKEDRVCKSELCIDMSAEVNQYVDKSLNPCDDFYAFSCERFAKNRKELPPSVPEEELNAMITEPINNNDTKAFIMQKAFYHSCVNLGAIEMDNDETLLDIFYSLGEWPVLKGYNWSGTYFDWIDVAKKSRRLGLKIDWFLEFSVYDDVNDTNTYVLQIDLPKSLMPLNSTELHMKKKLFTDVVRIMGAPNYLAHYETAKTIEFEDSLGIIAERQRGRAREIDLRSLSKLTINEVQVLWPSIQWLDLINNITGGRMIGSDYIIFNILDYVQELNWLIHGTPKRIVADYMMWKIVEENWQYLSQQVRDKFEKYNEEIFNKQPDDNRSKFCVNETKQQFPLVAESVYIRRHVTEEKRQLVREMLHVIKNKFVKMLHEATWMRRDARQRALAKLQDIKFLVGGPDELFDEFGFTEKLGLYGFSFQSGHIIDMLTQRKLQFYEKYYSVINKGVTNNTLSYYQKVINITQFVVINNNTLAIPAAVLRDAIYNPKLPNYYNYATLGKILAQEIFDYVFERSNQDTTHNRWASEVFDQATKCLVKEAAHFHISVRKTPRRMRDFLADFVAGDVAYEAYKEWAMIYPQESGLTALDFTPGQLFWIHTSKPSCYKIYTRHDRETARFKIVGPLRNSRSFAQEYHCPESSKMNPRKKCRIL